MTNTTQATFVVTACPVHGTTEVADFDSFRAYVDLARFCDHDAKHANVLHVNWHLDDGTSCWSCCTEQVVDPHGLLDH